MGALGKEGGWCKEEEACEPCEGKQDLSLRLEPSSSFLVHELGESEFV